MPDEIRVEFYTYWDVIAVLENDEGETGMIQEETFHNQGIWRWCHLCPRLTHRMPR